MSTMNTSGNPLLQDGVDGVWSVFLLATVILMFVGFLRWYRTRPQLSTGEATAWFFVIFLGPVRGGGAYLYRARTLRDPGK
ncbi:MAG: hypothetical protein L0L92_12590 [Corynebacterium variabile]|nr:hypothetical protein [Corynebacterium variabile]